MRRIERTLSPVRRRAANPVLRPLQKAVQRGTERRGQLKEEGLSEEEKHSRAIRTRPLRISATRWLVERGSSRRRKGFRERRSCWTQNQTWPRRLPKMVPITIDLEGRGGAKVVVVVVAEEEVEEVGEVGLVFLVWKRKDVLGRFFLCGVGVGGGFVVVVVVVVVVDGVKQGRKNRRRVSMVIVGGGEW